MGTDEDAGVNAGVGVSAGGVFVICGFVGDTTGLWLAVGEAKGQIEYALM